MASHHLIDAYLDVLARRLPAAAVAELADGVEETYQHHLSRDIDPDQSAAVAVAEFGTPDVVVAAFVDQASGRRAARALLCTGPVVGACWAAALVTGRAWTWAIPTAVRATFGVTLLGVIATLAVAATARLSYRRTRITAAAAVGLLALDTAMLAAALDAGRWAWLLAVAITTSMARIALTARAIPRLLAQ